MTKTHADQDMPVDWQLRLAREAAKQAIDVANHLGVDLTIKWGEIDVRYSHDLYETSDGNGEVLLGLCRRCGKTNGHLLIAGCLPP